MRPKKNSKNKAVRIHINLDYEAHENLKKQGVNISKTINQLLKVALFGISEVHPRRDVNNPALLGSPFL